MFSYHGWVFTYSDNLNTDDIRAELTKKNGDYPVSCEFVNGQIHIAFSGNPNRDNGELKSIIEFLIDLKADVSGCVYVNDANNSEKLFGYEVIKIVNDSVTAMDDRNFLVTETDLLFR